MALTTLNYRQFNPSTMSSQLRITCDMEGREMKIQGLPLLASELLPLKRGVFYNLSTVTLDL